MMKLFYSIFLLLALDVHAVESCIKCIEESSKYIISNDGETLIRLYRAE